MSDIVDQGFLPGRLKIMFKLRLNKRKSSNQTKNRRYRKEAIEKIHKV